VDNAAHTLCGLALARAGLDRYGAPATVTAVVASNLPDLDIVTHPLLGRPGYLCYHRGITHALLGMTVEALLLATVVWFVVRQWHPKTRWSPLLLAASLGLATHLALDGLNTYGIRPFLPFSERWYYGDAAFIMEPWVWLGFGFAACAGSPSQLTRATRNGWLLWSSAVFTLLAFSGRAPGYMVAVWVLGMGGALYLRKTAFTSDTRRLVSGGLSEAPSPSQDTCSDSPPTGRRRQRLALAGISVAFLYPLALSLPLNRVAGARAKEAVEALGDPVTSQTTHPTPATPWVHRAVVSTATHSYTVDVNLFGELELGVTLERQLDHPLLRRLEDTPEYHAWRVFTREPYVAAIDSHTLVLGDARYAPDPRKDAFCNQTVTVPGE